MKEMNSIKPHNLRLKISSIFRPPFGLPKPLFSAITFEGGLINRCFSLTAANLLSKPCNHVTMTFSVTFVKHLNKFFFEEQLTVSHLVWQRGTENIEYGVMNEPCSYNQYRRAKCF